jgi:hypothetical protein
MPHHHQIHLQALGEPGNFIDRMAERKVSLRRNAPLGQPFHAFAQDVPGGVFETAARHIGEKARTLGDAGTHVDNGKHMRFGFQIERQIRAVT